VQCSEGWTGNPPACGGTVTNIDALEVLTEFDLSQLEPDVIAAAFGSGFSVVAIAAVTGIAIAAILNLIKRG